MGFWEWLFGKKPKIQYTKNQIEDAYKECKSNLDEFGKLYDMIEIYSSQSLAAPVLKIIARLEKIKKEIDSEYAKIPEKSKYKRALESKIEVNNIQFAKLPQIKLNHSVHR